MKKYILLLSANLFLINSFCFGQGKPQLKAPLTKVDSQYIKSILPKYISYSAGVDFAYSNADVYPIENVKPSQPFNITQIKELQKKLKNNYNDADTYLEIGKVYSYDYQVKNCIKNFDKAIELYKERIAAKPDSSSSYDKLGNAYFFYGKYNDAISQYEKALKVNPNDTIAPLSIMVNALYNKDTETAGHYITQNFLRNPNSQYTLGILPMYYLCMAYQNLGNRDSAKYIQNIKYKTVDELCDFSLIKNQIQQQNNSIQLQLMYNISRQSILLVKTMVATLVNKNSLPNIASFKFYLDDADTTELNNLQSFYLANQNNPNLKSKYGIYKWLTSINYMRGNLKQAVLYAEESIKQKPLIKSTFESNSSTDYNNLAGIYLVMQDTANYEKTVNTRFKLKPSINHLPNDYLDMAAIAFHHKNYPQAKQYALTALEKNEKLTQAYICLAAIEINNNQIKAAVKLLDKAYEIEHDNKDVFLFEAICFLLNNDVSSAHFCFQKAIELGYLSDFKTGVKTDFMDKFFTIKQ